MVCPKFTYLLLIIVPNINLTSIWKNTKFYCGFIAIQYDLYKNKLDSINHLNLSFKPMQVKEEFLEWCFLSLGKSLLHNCNWTKS